MSTQTKEEMRAESLMRARTGLSGMNYPAIFAGFMAKGIPESEIKPRENVFTFNAWKALGRSVKKGEHGVKILTWISVDGKESETGEQSDGYRMPKTSTVFHISQTAETTEQQKAWDANPKFRRGKYQFRRTHKGDPIDMAYEDQCAAICDR